MRIALLPGGIGEYYTYNFYDPASASCHNAVAGDLALASGSGGWWPGCVFNAAAAHRDESYF